MGLASRQLNSAAMKNSDSFLRSGHWPTLLSAFLYFDVSFMVWVLLGALGNYIAGEFQLAPAQKGLMTAIPLLGGSIMRLIFGKLTDWLGPRRTGCFGLALTFVPLLGGWLWADSIGKVYAIGLLLGVAGASFAVALPMASRWYPARHQGLAMGIAGAGNSGTLVSTLCAPRLAEHLGWHAVFGLAMLSVLFGALALLFLGVAQFPPLAASMVLFFVIMGCLGIGNGSVFQLVPQRFRQRVGVATGILGAAGGLGGFFLPTLLGSLRQSSGSYGPGLMLFAALAVLALVVLAVVQNDWIGVWIAKHGRVRVADPADSAEHAEPA